MGKSTNQAYANSHRRMAMWLVLLIGTVLMLAACGGDAPAPTPTPVPTPASTPTPLPTEQPESGGVIRTVRSAPGAIVDGVQDGTSWVWDRVAGGSNWIWDQVTGAGRFLWDTVTSLPGDAWDAIVRFREWVLGTRVVVMIDRGAEVAIARLQTLAENLNPLELLSKLFRFLLKALLWIGAIVFLILLVVIIFARGVRRHLWRPVTGGFGNSMPAAADLPRGTGTTSPASAAPESDAPAPIKVVRTRDLPKDSPARDD